jgi:tRNA(fMet)-specific endonuclease VapC
MPSQASLAPVIYLLDTNKVGYIVTGKSRAARETMTALTHDDMGCISTISEAEIQYGLAKRPNATEFRSLMDGFLASVRILPSNRDEAYHYGLVRATLQNAGTPLGGLDMIAAHAVAIGAVLVTNDKAFGHVEDLYATVNWATDL